MTSTTLTIDQLRLSPHNVRINQEDADDTGALEDTILERGLIEPIVIHQMRGSRTLWGAIAGGRRYRAIRRLVDRGALPADWPVKVEQLPADLADADLIAISLIENMIRRNLREYEEARAVARMARKGDSPEKLAAVLGQRLLWVRRQIRLGSLAEPIFKAFEGGTRDGFGRLIHDLQAIHNGLRAGTAS